MVREGEAARVSPRERESDTAPADEPRLSTTRALSHAHLLDSLHDPSLYFLLRRSKGKKGKNPAYSALRGATSESGAATAPQPR